MASVQAAVATTFQVWAPIERKLLQPRGFGLCRGPILKRSTALETGKIRPALGKTLRHEYRRREVRTCVQASQPLRSKLHAGSFV